MSMNTPLSLDRILQSQGFGSRRECRGLVRNGRVSVAGQPCDDPFAEFATEALAFSVDGTSWEYRAKAYVLMNKPAGYECSHRPSHHPSVYALLPAPLVLRGVQCVGRLDEDTTGLLLFTDDGPWQHALLSPKRKVPKVYIATTRHPVDEGQVAALRSGVQLHDEPAPIAALACERIGEKVIHLTLAEGKYHQVKRMVAAAGNRVEGLTRIAIGTLALPDDLPPGQWRWLEPQACAALTVAQ